MYSEILELFLMNDSYISGTIYSKIIISLFDRLIINLKLRRTKLLSQL